MSLDDALDHNTLVTYREVEGKAYVGYWLEQLAGPVFGAILTGGATGLLGTVSSGLFDYFKQKQRNRHTLAMMMEERKTLELEIQGRERVAVIEAESAQEIAASKAFAASYQTDQARYSKGDHPALVWVDVTRGFTRPVITVALVAITTAFYFTAGEETQRQVVASVLYVTTAAVLWWFGTRVKQPK